MNPQSVAASQALSGERLTRSVTIPCTGDPELDLIAAFNTLCDQAWKDGVNQATVLRVLDYVLARAKSKGDFSLAGQWRFNQGSLVSPDGQQYSQISTHPQQQLPPDYTPQMLANALARPLR